MEDYKIINFSIIIPHYNSFEFLQKCLDAIPTNKDIQVIVVDDNSPDEERWNNITRLNPTVLFIRLDKNGGAGKARNEALKWAKGKWIIFSDADDYFVEKAFDIFREHINSNSDIIFFKSTSIDVVTGLASDRHLHINELIDKYNVDDLDSIGNLRYRLYGPPCKMIKRELLEQKQIFFDEVRYSNDVMFSVKVGYYADKIEVDKRIVYCISTNLNSLTRTMNYDAVMCRYQVTLRYNNFLKRVGAGKYRAVILRYLILGAKVNVGCMLEMIKLGLKYKTNFFSGLNRWRQIFNYNRRQLTHF